MGEAELQAAVSIASSSGAGGEVVLTDRGLKGRQVLSLREPLANWAAASIVHLDLSRNRLRDKGVGGGGQGAVWQQFDCPAAARAQWDRRSWRGIARRPAAQARIDY